MLSESESASSNKFFLAIFGTVLGAFWWVLIVSGVSALLEFGSKPLSQVSWVRVAARNNIAK